jgi:subtilase family serine protease
MNARYLSSLALLAVALCPYSLAQNVPTALARPSWATPERLREHADGTTSITIQVHLPLRDLGGAQAELEAVSDPDSPRYAKYLSSEEFESKYSPAAEDLAAVRSYLESEGFSITYAPRNRLFVTARATVADVERVFATRLGQYEADKGELRRAPIEPAQVPAVIAARVSGVLVLSTARARNAGLFDLQHQDAAPALLTKF